MSRVIKTLKGMCVNFTKFNEVLLEQWTDNLNSFFHSGRSKVRKYKNTAQPRKALNGFGPRGRALFSKMFNLTFRSEFEKQKQTKNRFLVHDSSEA